MAEDDKEENWAYSTSTSSADADNKDSSTGVSAFSTDPAKNTGDRQLSNWGEEPHIDGTGTQKGWSIWDSISRLFGASRS